ncbi:MAG: hotdog domain-containing protein [Acidimicrobiales bacterium]|jgi:predicted thioesterase|nr:hotdog domain-containing protein [Acidimicrobiales bacterium]MDP6160384.1 hotdog domain-containing protein [Acidimicrobiales bacterium]MDP6287950.1 hotdog domain-containing protein [Acidimicrobiales bacterium]MDP6911276.1 hotdog domain-containing protein [Acidimicrobiales bacterium]HJM73674.1 hotdog domain-containing protein [Acidimicrobiales bacterium]|tara:strand:+ start:115 stop:495 length:381 start_codon:yes stop_codon:yes gene_type:complete
MPGLRGRASHTVTDADTAIALRSGEVPVLGTPRLVALMEEASVEALDGSLADGETSVGMRIHVDHMAPTAPGVGVTAEAVLEGVEGRRLTFGATATVGDAVVATASIIRVVVETHRFLDRVNGDLT